MRLKFLSKIVSLITIAFASSLNVSCSSEDKDYFVFKALEDSSVSYVIYNDSEEKDFRSTFSLCYSIDRANWVENWDGSEVSLKKGEQLYLYNTTGTLNRYVKYDDYQMKGGDYINFKTEGKIELSGNIMALVHNAELSDCCFASLFCDNTSIVKAPRLPATKLTKYCYISMFRNCTNLVDVPDLPAVSLGEFSCQRMFDGCVSLERTPAFKIIETGSWCCHAMFCNCYRLKEIRIQFSAPTLVEHCYDNMFNSCYSLENAPSLPATTLADSCYRGMFCYCYNLKNAPSILPALSLEGASSCCRFMFQDCFNLKSAPKLLATTLAKDCYAYMFTGCCSLENVPELPATALVSSCYNGMFNSCKSLVKAPEIAATTMEGNDCLNGMFNGCSHLCYLKVHFPVECLDDTYTKNWLSNAGSSAVRPIFYSNEIKREDITPGPSTVPDYWDIQTYE